MEAMMKNRKCRRIPKPITVIIIIFSLILTAFITKKIGVSKDLSVDLNDLNLPNLTMFNITDTSKIPRNTHQLTFKTNSVFLAPTAGDKLCGGSRLGNKMFMIAAGLTTAQRSNVNFALPDCEWSASLLVIFPALRNYIILPKYITYKWVNYEEAESEFTLYQSLKISHNSTLDGFRQTWKYFSEPAEKTQLRKIFSLNSLLTQRAHEAKRDLLRSINMTEATTVGVHIRIGDLQKEYYHTVGYRTANITFYREAFRITSKLVRSQKKNSLVFLVASDSVDLAKKLLRPLIDLYKVVFTEQSDLVDFAILSLCDHSVISGGTYSFWSAFLAGGHVIYNDHYIEPDSKLAAGYNSRSFHCPEWTPL